MKLKLLFSLMLFASFGAFSQTFYTWNESITNTRDAGYVSTNNGTYTSGITNQSIAGVNTNAIVSKLEQTNSNPSLNFNLTTKVTNVTNFKMRIKVYADVASFSPAQVAKVRVYLRCNTCLSVSATQIFVDATLAAGQTWEELEFDFTGKTILQDVTDKGGFDRVTVLFAPGAGNKSTTYFFDDLQANTEQVVRQVWTGATSSSWDDDGNWSGVTPIATDNVLIPNNVANFPTIATGSTIIVNSINIQTGASLIAQEEATIEGTVIYNSLVLDDEFHLGSSPVVGEGYNNGWFISNEVAEGSTTASNRGVGIYQNGTPDLNTGPWVYAQANAGGPFKSGVGYALKRKNAGVYAFEGTYNDANLSIRITQDVNNWNLVGNPFSSYLLVSDVISDNEPSLTDTHEFIYVWNINKAGGAGYSILASSDYIHPGQGFFVNAATDVAGNFTITESLQSHQTGVTFYKNSSPKITLFLSDGSNSGNTEIEYNANATTSLDRGMDAGTFSGVASDFSIYSHLVSNSEGVDFMRQLLPNNDYENMVVPVGVKTVAGKEIIFTAEAMNLPNGIKVYLEDRLTNTFTDLSDNNSYKVNLDDSINGVGRFYVHTKSGAALSTDDVLSENISVYKTNNSTVRIVGLSSGKSNLKLFNILGKLVMNTSFISDGVKDITLPNLAKGVYIVQLENDSSKLNKKIILE
jgi:hypothetical protein